MTVFYIYHLPYVQKAIEEQLARFPDEITDVIILSETEIRCDIHTPGTYVGMIQSHNGVYSVMQADIVEQVKAILTDKKVWPLLLNEFCYFIQRNHDGSNSDYIVSISTGDETVMVFNVNVETRVVSEIETYG